MRRFANSSCPVCTHIHSFVFNDLGSSHLHERTSFADYSAPIVHQKSGSDAPPFLQINYTNSTRYVAMKMIGSKLASMPADEEPGS
jgi:hypothetical protein